MVDPDCARRPGEPGVEEGEKAVRKLLALGAALAAALAIGIVPASAITDGELDGNGHPGVVLL